MRRAVAAELLKLRTTHTGGLFLLAVVALVAISVSAPSVLVGGKHDPHTVVEGAASLALTLTLLLGITMSAGDEQQGGVVNSLLVAPRRARLVVAKVVAAMAVGVLFAAITALLSIGIELIFPASAARISAKESLLTAGGIMVAGPLLAIGVGTILRSQALAVGASLVWLYVGELFVSQLSYPAYTWLPGGDREALLRHVSATHVIPPMWAGGLVLAVYGLGMCAIGAWLLSQRDLT
jgi:ABC-2 type transport system permease protein